MCLTRSEARRSQPNCSLLNKTVLIRDREQWKKEGESISSFGRRLRYLCDSATRRPRTAKTPKIKKAPRPDSQSDRGALVFYQDYLIRFAPGSAFTICSQLTSLGNLYFFPSLAMKAVHCAGCLPAPTGRTRRPLKSMFVALSGFQVLSIARRKSPTVLACPVTLFPSFLRS
jgi:hypothetical protein